MSADGTRIVGEVWDLTGGWNPALWENGVLSLLPALSTGTAFASAISDDGNVIVGYSDTSSGVRQLVRWVHGSVEQLSDRPGGYWAGIARVSGDGSLIVGGEGPDEVWKEGFGRISLQKFFGYHGLESQFAGYGIMWLEDLTPDGRYLAGTAIDTSDGNWQSRSYLVYLDPADFAVPEPSSLSLAGFAAMGLIWVRRRSRNRHDSRRMSY